MLQRLYINNYAIINELEINFSKGMNIITGETGAGKSIIIGALNLILGERADSTALVNKEKKCVIEGVFAGEKENVNSFLANNDLDAANEITVRREIAVNGKSRAFINDTPVNLTQLQELSSLLVDLHQQFDTLAVGDNNFQINVLDALAGNRNAMIEYRNLYNDWQICSRKLFELKQQQLQFEKESDYNRFQFNELNDASFRENEIEEIDAELKTLTHAEGIKEALGRAYSELSESEQPVVQQLKSLVNQLNNYSNYHKDLPQIIERLQSTQIELHDISNELETLDNHINYDAEKIEQLNERLSLGYRLQKKHGVQTTNELIEIQQQLEEKLQAVLHINDDIAKLEKETESFFGQLNDRAGNISQARKKQVKPLEEKVNKLLAQVGMPNASLKVSVQNKEPGITGKDAIEFLFDANKSGQFKPVSKVASGGELSRLMLCIKSLVAQSMDMPTLIFDEIDSGISGEAAKQVGIIMKELATSRQMICITHQPQIAGKADAHFFVYKELSGNTVTTNIRELNNDERITTIAKMLSGEKPTAAAMENAREMVQN
ncbi:MAG: DNA repair protein RecN [Sphingobacteriales bacterium 41-5]|nr:MAG: DNA repair protein RecN [Sphingobacteriales bacterium 41-5]